MRDDTPDDLVHDLFAEALFPGHPLGREIARLRGDHHGDAPRRSRRVPPRALPARQHGDRRGGNLDARRRSSTMVEAALPGRRRSPARPRARVRRPATRSRSRVLERPTEQAHLVLGTACVRPRSIPTATRCGRQPGARRRDVARVSSRRSARSAARRTRCSRTGARSKRPARSRCTAAPSPEHVDEVLDVVDGELDRLVADGGVSRGRARARQGSLRARSPCRSRPRRAACAASAGPSSRSARSRHRRGGRAGRGDQRRRHRAASIDRVLSAAGLAGRLAPSSVPLTDRNSSASVTSRAYGVSRHDDPGRRVRRRRAHGRHRLPRGGRRPRARARGRGRPVSRRASTSGSSASAAAGINVAPSADVLVDAGARSRSTSP